MAASIHVFYCYGGNRNFGDDYILDQWIRFALDNAPSKKLIANCGAAWMQAYHMDDPVFFNDFLAGTSKAFVVRAKEGAEALGVAGCIRAGIEAAEHMLENNTAWRSTLSRISAFHVCGGGFLNDHFRFSFAAVSMMATLAKRLGVPLYGTGLGLLPLQRDTPGLAELFGQFTLIETRDHQSFEFVKAESPEANVIFGVDDTFISEVKTSREPDRSPALYINVQKDMKLAGRHQSLLDGIMTVMEANRGHFSSVRYLNFFQKHDMQFVNVLRKAVADAAIYDKDLIFEDGLPFRPGDFCISTRFHCHLLASRAGVKGSYISGSAGYYDIKHGSVAKLGSNWPSFFETDPATLDFGTMPAPMIDEVGIRTRKQELARTILA
ncbi:polysaccharide pyruvyl transferase family protein [Roseomonas sp. WA12]